MRSILRIIILPVALLLVTVITVFWILAGIRLQVDNRLGSSLQTVLSTTDKALQNWAEQTEDAVSALAASDGLPGDVEAQLRIARSRPALLDSPALKNIRRRLAPAMKFHHFPGFAIVAPDGTQIAAENDDAVGVKDIGDHNKEVLARAMTGKTTFGLPFTSPLYSDQTTHLPYRVMTAGAPIRDDKGNAIAALALRLDPRRDFTRAVRLGRLEKTGETYAFDANGRLLTETRFQDELREAELIPPDADSVLSLELRDPGGNTDEGFRPAVPRDQQPFTRAVQSAIAGHSGIDLNGYHDYRGVPVIGAWLWDKQLGMGLVTEIDVAEAFAPYRRVRELVIVLLLLTAGASFALLLILRHRDRLASSNVAFQQALHAREDLMAIVSHDLKNPINTILLRSHVLIQALEGKPADAESLKHSLRLMQRTARHMNQLIGDLTDAARIQAGRLHVDLLECSLEEAVEPAIERAQLLAKEQGVKFAVSVAPDLPRISADTGRLTQVLDNLIGNALKFTPAGGRITITVGKVQSGVEISVSDTGPGIPNEALSRIFDPYWQVQKTRSGMGLGLFIAKTLVTAHGGKMWVESLVGRGTTFYFTLPATQL